MLAELLQRHSEIIKCTLLMQDKSGHRRCLFCCVVLACGLNPVVCSRLELIQPGLPRFSFAFSDFLPGVTSGSKSCVLEQNYNLQSGGNSSQRATTAPEEKHLLRRQSLWALCLLWGWSTERNCTTMQTVMRIKI